MHPILLFLWHTNWYLQRYYHYHLSRVCMEIVELTCYMICDDILSTQSYCIVDNTLLVNRSKLIYFMVSAVIIDWQNSLNSFSNCGVVCESISF